MNKNVKLFLKMALLNQQTCERIPLYLILMIKVFTAKISTPSIEMFIHKQPFCCIVFLKTEKYRINQDQLVREPRVVQDAYKCSGNFFIVICNYP